MKQIDFKALRVSETPEGQFIRRVEMNHTGSLPDNGVLIRVLYSSLNYKDALSASGNRGVTRRYPHTPGIDAAGIVEHCPDGAFRTGEEVIVTGYDLGMNTPGGFGEFIKVPSEWIVPKPAGLTMKESMILGTAGFTAALAVHHLLRGGQEPGSGPILVTGSSGGVGSLAMNLLANLGFNVIAATGKPEMDAILRNWGAKDIIGRSEVDDHSGKALLRPKWAGAIDNVGGNTLATILKACAEHGSVCTCGNVSSPELHTTVFPFILNGVNLLGVNSATTPMKLRKEIWSLLSTDWKPSNLEEVCRSTNLEGLEQHIVNILAGKNTGRVVIEHTT